MQRFVLRMILFYRHHLSHHKRKSTCRFIPTCSEYAYTAIERFGVLRGGRMALWRLLRCNPFSQGGYDPVPEDPLTTLRRD
ncbi:MAG: membrane protein insertion efficiency factor YidD [Clostridia bacterium]|nr:membrane protein insertion efficiency factor YidD [Clostridia bacterium]